MAVTYEKHILAMQDFPGFYAQWISRVRFYRTHEEAYEATEEFYVQYFGRRKYKSYDSFRVAMSQNNKK